uniref:Uncharacterized protein n=1 Tax=Tetraselmis chuii TaxID=63592 RepID=A0A7S1SHD7_9CHLO|mmetsp:Transcript_11457/g.20725  ORF Transcript_11457/g.20725 Transcript_11457/m.20725 type:complete len:173 (+) Transcript_11457:184-702(+)
MAILRTLTHSRASINSQSSRGGPTLAMPNRPALRPRQARLICRANSKGDEEDAFSGPVAKMMDGLYSKEGYRIKYGVFKEKVEPPAKMSFAEYMDASEEVRQSRQAEAAKELVNIDKDERGRRETVGTYLLSGTGITMLIFWLLGAPAPTRALLSLPLFFGLGFTLSGKAGL